MNEQLFVCCTVADELGMTKQPELPNVCNVIDVETQLFMSVEFVESRVGTWIWDCQSIVGDIQVPDPMIFLEMNDSGLMWCYYAVNVYQAGRRSLNLKYTFCTPAGDQAFALKALKTVLFNMRKHTLETRSRF